MNLQHKYTLEDILEGCKKGESRYQELLYQQYASKLLGICMRYAKDKPEAEDMMQTGFIKIFRKVNDFRGEGSFEGWMKRIMVHTSIEFYRKNLRNLQLVEIDETHSQQAVTDFDMSRLMVQDLLKLINGLSPGYKMVFNLYAIEGYSHKEISAQLGITEGASKSQLSRARAILKEQVTRMEGYNYESNAG